MLLNPRHAKARTICNGFSIGNSMLQVRGCAACNTANHQSNHLSNHWSNHWSNHLSNHRPQSPRTLVRDEGAGSVQGVQGSQGRPMFHFQLDEESSYAAASIAAGRELT
jgi:hypothetical protein